MNILAGWRRAGEGRGGVAGWGVDPSGGGRRTLGPPFGGGRVPGAHPSGGGGSDPETLRHIYIYIYFIRYTIPHRPIGVSIFGSNNVFLSLSVLGSITAFVAVICFRSTVSSSGLHLKPSLYWCSGSCTRCPRKAARQKMFA